MTSIMDVDETFIIDKLTEEQIKGLRAAFQRVVKKYDKEQLATLKSAERNRHRDALSQYYSRLFRVSSKLHPRATRPQSSIKKEPPNENTLEEIHQLEERVKQLSERNEKLKKENHELMATLASKVTQEQGRSEKVDMECEATELSLIAEQPVLEWLIQFSPAFDQILEELNEMDETTAKTEEKLKSLATVAEKRLKKKNVDTSQPTAPASLTGGQQQTQQGGTSTPAAPVRFKYGFGK